MVLEENTVIRRNPRVAFRDLDKESGGVLLHLDTAAYHSVNAVGALVWSRLENDATLAEVLSGVRSQVENPSEDMDTEITSFLEELEQRDLVSFGSTQS